MVSGCPDPSDRICFMASALAASSVGMTAATRWPRRPTAGLRPTPAPLPWLVRDLVQFDTPLAGKVWRAETSAPRPSMVARTMLCGLVEPRLLVRMSVIPAHSSTARTWVHRRSRLYPLPPVFENMAPAGTVLSHYLVGNGRAGSRQFDHRALGGVHGLPLLRDLVGLTRGNPDLALAVPHRHERVEGEPPAALHNLGDAIDGDDVLDVIAGTIPVTAVPPRPTTTTSVTPLATPAATAARSIGACRSFGDCLRVAGAARLRGTTFGDQIDLATVIKTSQAVAGEIVLEKLIETLMVIAVEHAGADRGLFILFRTAANTRSRRKRGAVAMASGSIFSERRRRHRNCPC